MATYGSGPPNQGGHTKEHEMKMTPEAVSLTALLLLSQAVAAQVQTISAQCTTDATGADGKRHACDSEVQKFTAPENHVFAVNTLKGGLTKSNGSEKSCSVGWDDLVEVIEGTDIKQPRTISLRAHARSPNGHASGRGWATCVYSAKLTKYK
jgi:hypothetical protein